MPFKDPERKKAYDKQWELNNPEARAGHYRKYHQSLKGQITLKKSIAKWTEKNPEKFRAEHIARYYPKANECELCGIIKGLTRHHLFGYDYPKIFVTLCYHCHKDAEKNQVITDFEPPTPVNSP